MRDIPGYEGLYAVTSCGKVWSYRRNRFMTITTRSDNYQVVTLFKDKKLKVCTVHRLVAKAFLPNPNNLPDVNHKDEIQYHNWIGNLEWCTHNYNMNYGTLRKRQAKACGKPLYCVELDKVFPSLKSASKATEINIGNISACCKGKLNTAGGYHWKYCEE